MTETKNIKKKRQSIFKNCFVESKVYKTKKGTSYLKKAGIALISYPKVELVNIKSFLLSYPDEYQFISYLKDPKEINPAEKLCKFAGQMCYLSMGPKRTLNKDAQTYFDNIIFSGHGSVLEHANFSFLIWGISRSLTHELVRHRVGCAYSQISQRYVSGRALRFVERPEYQADKTLHQQFEQRIDRIYEEYSNLIENLYSKQEKGLTILKAEEKTDLRKKVQQVARSLLPNETEAPIVFTANIRSLRHIINMRASEHAEVEIRKLFFAIFLIMKRLSPIIFKDFKVVKLSDGTFCVKTDYPKV